MGYIDTLQALLHPFRPLSTPYPPGELPPPNVLDELTHQIVKYAYRPSPMKRSSRSKVHPKPHPHEDGWTHTWDATRRKVFRLALAESQHAHGMDAEDRKLPRNERVGRPGLKRMDSMDFLDQAEEEEQEAEAAAMRRKEEAENVGRAIRLSTSLQNSARSNPLNTLTRTMSDDVTTTTSSSSGSSSTATLMVLPTLPAAITVTPASPVGPPPPLRRKGSSRASQVRPSRPSLLQRGRSFTASDLEADSSILPDSPVAKGPTDRAGDENAAKQEAVDRTAAFVASTSMSTNLLNPHLAMTAVIGCSSRLTRSQSSNDNCDPHAFRTSFLADRQPSTTQKSALALPFDAPTPRPSLKSSANVKGGWSDSDEEGSTRLRHVKKVKPVRGHRPKLAAALQPSLQAEVLAGPALRSPFEEKTGMSF